jgi:hypothetical protein
MLPRVDWVKGGLRFAHPPYGYPFSLWRLPSMPRNDRLGFGHKLFEQLAGG